MNKFKCFVFLVFITIFLSLCLIAVEVAASFSVENLPKDTENSFIDNINLSLFLQEPEKQGITVFDVNENGLIAIGSEHFDKKTICVYSNEGDFQYGYRFNCSGSFGLEWNNDNLNIYFVRSDVWVEVDLDGNINQVKKIQNTIENNEHWNNIVFAKKKTVNNTIYSVENDIGFLNLLSTDYSQLIKTDPAGEKNIIYNVNSKQILKSYVPVFLIFVLLVITLIKLKKGKVKSGVGSKPLKK